MAFNFAGDSPILFCDCSYQNELPTIPKIFMTVEVNKKGVRDTKNKKGIHQHFIRCIVDFSAEKASNRTLGFFFMNSLNCNFISPREMPLVLPNFTKVSLLLDVGLSNKNAARFVFISYLVSM